MSSLLAPRSSPAPVPTPPPPPHLPPAHHASLPAAAAAAAAIAAAGTGAGPGITHGSPFAVHAYAPPSGAPGFAGDRAWDKGFAFDGPALEKRSVRLAGRRETTDAVLSTELADKVRPRPAVASVLRPPDVTRNLNETKLTEQHGDSTLRCAADPPAPPAARAPPQGVDAALQPRPARYLAPDALRALRGARRRWRRRARRRARRGRRAVRRVAGRRRAPVQGLVLRQRRVVSAPSLLHCTACVAALLTAAVFFLWDFCCANGGGGVGV